MTDPLIAYFSMEIALDPALPTYSGGLGILAGDTLRAAADLSIPMCAVTLVHRKGYFRQQIDAEGRQHEELATWRPEEILEEAPHRTTVELEGRQVHIRAWKYDVVGITGHRLPVFLLDTDLHENGDYDRTLTDQLYGGDHYYRLCQELILGVGGVRILRALGFQQIARFHMNEGHAALLGLELLDEQVSKAGRDHLIPADVEAVRKLCVFTTHTPVPAGHDRFPMDWVRRLIGGGRAKALQLGAWMCPVSKGEVFDEKSCPAVWDAPDLDDQHLNMTYLALNLSRYVNGVAKRHAEVSRDMFARYQIDAITNGVHAGTWVSPPFAALFDQYIAGWRSDNYSLRAALKLPRAEVWSAHLEAKRSLFASIKERSGVEFDETLFTIGIARRATEYKRLSLLVSNPDKLKELCRNHGPIQIVFAGKAHPADGSGKDIIASIIHASRGLAPEIKLVYLADYDFNLGKQITTGVDLWLNTPLPPLEASGTSGMKAALNGVPSLSVLDGWWIEGCVEEITGWSFGKDKENDPTNDAGDLYQKLDRIIPMYYERRDEYITIMRHCISLNGSFFNTQRMVQEYVVKAYFV